MNKNYNAKKACGGEKQKSIKISEYLHKTGSATFWWK